MSVNLVCVCEHLNKKRARVCSPRCEDNEILTIQKKKKNYKNVITLRNKYPLYTLLLKIRVRKVYASRQ